MAVYSRLFHDSVNCNFNFSTIQDYTIFMNLLMSFSLKCLILLTTQIMIRLQMVVVVVIVVMIVIKLKLLAQKQLSV